MTEHTHIMVDLETLGTAPGSAIASIGACVFDPVTGEIGATFYETIKLSSCQAAGLTFDADTLAWWLSQEPAAQRELVNATGILEDVLCAFRDFYTGQNGGFLWCHGANFDEPLLVAAFQAFSYRAPWGYWAVRCTRTLYALAGVKPDRSEGTHHNALDDARAQARAVHAAYRKLGLSDIEPIWRVSEKLGPMLQTGCALGDVAAERIRQVEAELWTPAHDDEHGLGELSLAGAAYAANASYGLDPVGPLGRFALALWPWRQAWWKPKDPRRDLVRAGALIVAEIERLDRKAARDLAAVSGRLA